MQDRSTVLLLVKNQGLEMEKKLILDKPSSPFQPLSGVLRALQVLGIFNFSIHDDCGRFVHRPSRLIYFLILDVFFFTVPYAFCLLWFHASKMTLEELRSNVGGTFSKTDFVGLGGILGLLQLANLGLQFSSKEFGRHLNELVIADAKVGKFIGEGHPSVTNLFRDLGLIMALLLSSQFMIGYSFPSLLGFAPSIPLKVCLGLSQSLAVTYLSLNKTCCETLFLRMINVLEFYYSCLLEKMERNNERSKRGNSSDGTDTFLDSMLSLVDLFRSLEKAFQRQLLMQHLLMMGALIFAIYISISILIASNADSDLSHVTFTVGFLLYSLVPALKLVITASSTDRVIVKMQAVRINLYELEASAGNEKLRRKIRLAIRKYEGIDGFSACNYFTVNPKLFTSILGYLTTYIIVMIQFKLAETSFQKKISD